MARKTKLIVQFDLMYWQISNESSRYPTLRVAYIDEREETINGIAQKVYYSVLVKGGDKLDEVQD